MLGRLCGQALTKGILGGAARAGRLGHAYLFSGPDGTGKSIAAEDLASFVLGAPAAQHPDYHVVAPERRSFLRAQAREVCRLAALRPYAGERSVFVLKRAEALTGEAAATLLKLIEEPPSGALFVLICEHAAQVEATLRSRCQVVPFVAVPPIELAPWLAGRGLPDAEALAAASGGNPGEALRLATDEAWRLHLEQAEQLAGEVGTGDLADELARAARAAEDEMPLAALARALQRRLGAGAPGPPDAWALMALEAWLDAEAALSANVTRRLTWEVLLLRLRRARAVRYDASNPGARAQARPGPRGDLDDAG